MEDDPGHPLPTWESIIGIIDAQAALADFAGPGGWNDPDMLQFGNGDLTAQQNRSHFAMWCMLAAPLFLGTDISAISDVDVAILTEPTLLRIDQDPLGQQARRILEIDGVQLWSRTLADGSTAVALFNPTDRAHSVPFRPSMVGLDDQQPISLLTGDTGPVTRPRQGSIRIEPFGTILILLGAA